MNKRMLLPILCLTVLLLNSVVLGANGKSNVKNYSIKFVIKDESQQVSSIEKQYVRDGIMLRSDTMNVTTNRVEQATIVREDKRVMWTIGFAENWYLEAPYNGGISSVAIGGEIESITKKLARKTGEEKYQGYLCEIYEMVQDDVRTQYWIYKGDLIPLKILKYDHNHLVLSMESSEFSMEKPPLSLFELPAGIKKLGAM